MRSLSYFEVPNRRFVTSIAGGANFSLPTMAAGQSFTMAVRGADVVNAQRVEVDLPVRSLRATLGPIDARPTSGRVKFQFGNDISSALNTSDWIDWNVASDVVQAKLQAIPEPARPADIVVAQDAESWIISRADGEALNISCVANELVPASFPRIRGYQENGRWYYDVRLTQAPYAFTSSFDRVDPPAPSIYSVRDGVTIGEFTSSEVQGFNLPPDFRGTYQIRDPRTNARTDLLDPTDGPEDIQKALQAILAEGETVAVTNPQANIAHFEFGGSLAGVDLPLFEVTVFDAPAGDVTFTIDLAHPVLFAALRSKAILKDVPLQVEFELVESLADLDDVEAPTKVVTSVAILVTLVRPAAWEGLAAAANTDWLRPPLSNGYRPYAPGQIITGQQHYEEVIGDGGTVIWPIDHNLATEALSSISVRENFDGGRYLRENEYEITAAGPNSVVIDFTGSAFGVPAAAGLVVIVTSAGPTSVFQAHGHTTAQITRGDTPLDDLLDDLYSRVGTLEDAQASIGPAAVEKQASGITITLPETKEVLFYTGAAENVFNFAVQTPVARGVVKASEEKVFSESLIFNAAALPAIPPYLLPAVHDATVTDTTTVPAAAAGSVWKNNAAPVLLVPGGGQIRSSKVAQNEFMASDGRIVFAASKSGTTNSYYPRAYERELWRMFVDPSMLAIGRTLDAQFGLALQLVNATSNAQWVLVIEKGTAPQDTTPSTTGINLQNIVWDATPILSCRIILTPLQETRSFGLRLKRTVVSSVETFSLDTMLNGIWTGNDGLAPASADFALRARLINFDTENALASDARGWVAYQVIGAGGLGEDGGPVGKPKATIS